MDVDSNPDNEKTKNPDAHAAALNALFKSRVQGYYNQLMQGCGSSKCENCFCRSNAGLKKFQILPNEAAVLSMHLARVHLQSEYMCPEVNDKGNDHTDKSERTVMDLETLKSLVDEAKVTNNYTPIIILIGIVFGSIDSLTVSFLKSPKEIRIDGTDTGLNIDHVREAYNIISRLPKNVVEVLESALRRLMFELKPLVNATHTLSSLRKFIILLQNPMLSHHPFNKKFTGDLFELCSQLSTQSKTFLKNHFYGRMDEHFSEKDKADYMIIFPSES
jgi:hypothetical protein